MKRHSRLNGTGRASDEITDEELNAYVDGELSARRMDEIASAAAQDERIAERINAIRQINASLQAYGRASLQQPLPPRLRALLDRWLGRH